jgi:hypothetical protein
LVVAVLSGLLAASASADPVRYFDDGDEIRVRVNPENDITGAITMVALVNADLELHYYITLLNEKGSPVGYKFQQTEEGRLSLTNGEGGTSDSSLLAEGEWQLLAVSKAAGEAKPRFHVYSYATETWAHRDGAEAMPNGLSVTNGRIRFGGPGSKEYAAAALYPRALSDGEVEDLAVSYEDWLELDPTGMWIFNQPDLSKPVLDETGGGANEILEETSGTEVHQDFSLPGGDPDGTLFRGDFYRGVNLEWAEEQQVGATALFAIEELSPPLPFENYFGRYSLSTGDIRSEMRSALHLYSGEDVYVRFLARLSKGFPVEESPTVWGELIWQLHDGGTNGSPPLALAIHDVGLGRYALEDANGTVWWQGPEIDYETWHEFIVRVNHSEDAETGFAEVWMDGVQQKMIGGSNRYYGPTLVDEFNYPKSGYYRDDDMVGSGSVDIAGYRIAKNLSDLP